MVSTTLRITVATAIALSGVGALLYINSRRKKRSMEIGSVDEVVENSESSNANDNLVEDKDTDTCQDIMDIDDLSSLPRKKREELALAAKNRGNKYYAGQKFAKAAELYTKAIELCPKGDSNCAIYHSNRAACYANMGDFQKVISDCTAALEVDGKYVKAILRRASAFEKTGNDSGALEDYTLACFLDKFQNSTTVQSADRVLRRIAAAKAKDLFSGQYPNTLPSHSFCSAYLGSFRFDYSRALPSEPRTEADTLVTQAVNAYSSKNWDLALELCGKALDGAELSTDFQGLALNMRGTFLFLMGRPEEAYADYERALEITPLCVNTHIKIACLMMEKEIGRGIDSSIKWFEKALQIEDQNPDVFYHRGQVHFLVEDYSNALADYEKSIELDPGFVFAHIQRAVTLYRLGSAQESQAAFDSMLLLFSDSADVHYYYGEILLVQQRIDEAIKVFDKAISIDPSVPLPYLNKGITFLHVKDDIEAALAETKKAISVDPRCDLAYMNLAQMNVHLGKMEEAITAYEKAVNLARTQMDAENSIMGLEATKAQMKAIKIHEAPV